MGNTSIRFAYRTFHERRCYELAINIDQQDATPYDPGEMPKGFGAEEYDKVRRRLDGVLSTFRFAKPRSLPTGGM